MCSFERPVWTPTYLLSYLFVYLVCSSKENIAMQRSFPAVTESAFLLQGNTSCSGGTTNGTVLPSGYFSENKEYLQKCSSFIVFTEMTGISLNHLLHHTVLEPCSFTKMCGLLLPNPEKSALFHLSDNSHRFFHTSGKRSSDCTVPIGRKFSPVFPYKWKAPRVRRAQRSAVSGNKHASHTVVY